MRKWPFCPSSLPWFLGLTNNHQNIRNTWMNLPYLNKKNNKCTIYKITRFKGSVSSQFQSLICHKSILQFIYHQIKDKVHNHHRSLGLLGLGLAWRKSWFFGIFKYTLRIGEQRKQKQQASNSNESSLPILSLFDQVITTSYTKIPTYKIYNNSVQFIT